MGFPFEHGLHATLIAMRLGDRLGVDRATASQTYYACLLSHAGCTTDAHIAAEIFGGSMTMEFHPVMYGSGREAMLGILRALSEPDRTAPVRAFQVATRLPRLARVQRRESAAACEVAGMLAGAVGVPPSVAELLAYLTERWDGRGPLRRAKGEQIPLPTRSLRARNRSPGRRYWPASPGHRSCSRGSGWIARSRRWATSRI